MLRTKIRPSSVTFTLYLPDQMFQIAHTPNCSCNSYVSLTASGLDKNIFFPFQYKLYHLSKNQFVVEKRFQHGKIYILFRGGMGVGVKKQFVLLYRLLYPPRVGGG